MGVFLFLVFGNLANASTTPNPIEPKVSIEQAINEIQFCKEVTSVAEAERKAVFAEALKDPATCWAANLWSLDAHRALLAKGFLMEMFIASRYIRKTSQRIEIFVWYADNTGKKRTFWNSCELSDEAKQYIAKYPQTAC